MILILLTQPQTRGPNARAANTSNHTATIAIGNIEPLKFLTSSENFQTGNPPTSDMFPDICRYSQL